MLHKFCIAPMIDYTDRHCRYFFRKLTKNAFLYSEMVVSEAIVYGDKDFFLKFDESEHPVALQIAGSNPKNLSYISKSIFLVIIFTFAFFSLLFNSFFS